MSSMEFTKGLPDFETGVGDSVYTDELTGLRNRRYLLERLQEECEKAQRYAHPLSCVLFDIDEIRADDEELGPAPLDDLLIEVGMAIRDFSRTYDIVARYDSTMFVVVLPHTTLKEAVGYTEKILEQTDGTTFSDPSYPSSAKLSAGVAASTDGSLDSAELILGEAMRRLLQAKSNPDERLSGADLAKV